MTETILLMAAKEYLDRQRGRRYPSGEWVGNIYFFPDKYKEKLECCEKPLREMEIFPTVMFEHLKSIKHIANRYEVNPQHLRLMITKLKFFRRYKCL